MFIGDTGASSDTTTLTRSFKNTRKGGSKDNIPDASDGGLKGKLVSDVLEHFAINMVRDCMMQPSRRWYIHLMQD